MNPLKHLLPALYAALASPALRWAEATVPVFEHLPANLATHYVLLQQPTATAQAGSQGCRAWSCTVLIDVVTQFAADAISSEPADELADQIAARLDFQRLALSAGWETGPARLDLSTELRELDELAAVRRLLRYRWEVYYEPATLLPPLPWVFDGTFPVYLS